MNSPLPQPNEKVAASTSLMNCSTGICGGVRATLAGDINEHQWRPRIAAVGYEHFAAAYGAKDHETPGWSRARRLPAPRPSPATGLVSAAFGSCRSPSSRRERPCLALQDTPPSVSETDVEGSLGPVELVVRGRAEVASHLLESLSTDVLIELAQLLGREVQYSKVFATASPAALETVRGSLWARAVQVMTPARGTFHSRALDLRGYQRVTPGRKSAAPATWAAMPAVGRRCRVEASTCPDGRGLKAGTGGGSPWVPVGELPALGLSSGLGRGWS